MKLSATKTFQRDLNKLLKDKKNKIKVKKTLSLLLQNVNHPSLRLHKLTGTANYSISVDTSVRIIIHFEKNIIHLLRIGSHQLVY